MSGSNGNGKIPSTTGTDREVGYCRPPAEHRFKSGNQAAKGRKTGLRVWQRIQRQFMRKIEDGDHAGKRNVDRFAETFVEQCIGGSVPHAKEVIEREEGKVPDRIAGPDGGPPVVKVIRGVSMDDL